MESNAFYSVRGFYGKSRAGGAKRVQGGLNPQSCAALWAAEGSMGSDAFYSVRGLLLKSLPVRADVQAGSTRQPARRGYV